MSASGDQYNRGGLIAFTFSMVFVFSFFFYVVLIHGGVDLGENARDPNQGSGEAAAQPAFNISSVKEPWLDNPEVVAHGAKIFAVNCAMCHGDKGMGDGAAGSALNPKPRNLVEGKWTKGGDSISLFKTLTEGIAGTSMAAYNNMTAADRWALVQFVHSITKNRVADDATKLSEFAGTAK